MESGHFTLEGPLLENVAFPCHFFFPFYSWHSKSQQLCRVLWKKISMLLTYLTVKYKKTNKEVDSAPLSLSPAEECGPFDPDIELRQRRGLPKNLPAAAFVPGPEQEVMIRGHCRSF